MSSGRRLARSLVDPRLTFALRLASGAVLIYASYSKLLDPQPLADTIDDYRILPLELVDLAAIVLPWVEFVTGVCLVVGLGASGAGLVTATLAGVYCTALISALLRGLDIGCGCFGDGSGQLLSWSDLWLRLVLLAAGVQIAVAAHLVDWPLAAVIARATGSRRATGRASSL